ncbi:hypothetical protein SAMN05660226_03623 [Parapedobacter luteus]|uniref:Response regulatory domain-containing protein n=1 Tax=Parapedobacter luteus TaxID=623280 RepID=A0A1T5EXH9_9SPHI|nr:hypothetical protein [Parapedobacter luteus]SKB88653.1 hypothetical protein SAMN05660226_03623 [Parapedobacter luteus]
MYSKFNRTTCLLIEDEALAIEMMEDYIGRRDDLVLLAVVSELSEVKDILVKHTPSIIFLDLFIPPGACGDFHFGKLPSNASIVIVSGTPPNLFRGILPKGDIYELFKPVSYDSFNRCVDEVLAKHLKD